VTANGLQSLSPPSQKLWPDTGAERPEVINTLCCWKTEVGWMNCIHVLPQKETELQKRCNWNGRMFYCWFKNTSTEWDCSSAVECLPSMCETLGSIHRAVIYIYELYLEGQKTGLISSKKKKSSKKRTKYKITKKCWDLGCDTHLFFITDLWVSPNTLPILQMRKLEH
jgi:hypothetical protein